MAIGDELARLVVLHRAHADAQLASERPLREVGFLACSGRARSGQTVRFHRFELSAGCIGAGCGLLHRARAYEGRRPQPRVRAPATRRTQAPSGATRYGLRSQEGGEMRITGVPPAAQEDARERGTVATTLERPSRGLANAADVLSRGLSSSSLVGRTEELRALLKAASHPPTLVLIEGEAGVGKTRLVQEFLRSSELGAVQRWSGGCQHLAEPLPLGPLLDALRTSLQVRTDLDP